MGGRTFKYDWIGFKIGIWDIGVFEVAYYKSDFNKTYHLSSIAAEWGLTSKNDSGSASKFAYGGFEVVKSRL